MNRLHLDWPPVWLVGFVILLRIQSRLLPVGGFGEIGSVLGRALCVVGIVLMLTAIFWMARAHTTIIPHQAPQALVTTGPFALSRNPIYLGDTLVLAGVGLLFHAMSVILLLPLFIFVINRRFILPEEARLKAVFGHSFAEWAARVRRWI